MILKNLLAIFMGIFLFLSISFVYADSVKDADLQSCSCSLISNPITVENLGSSLDTFYISQQGSAAKWSNVFPDMVILGPGEAATAENLINTPCDAEGDYILETRIDSSKSTDTIVQKLSLKKCSNIGVVFKNLTQNACNCTPFEFDFWVTNTGEHNEIYNMKLLDKDSLAVTTSVNPIILMPGQTQEMRLYVTPACEVVGEHKAVFRIIAQDSEFYADAPLTLYIDACPPVQVNVSDNATAPPTFVAGVPKPLLILFGILIAILLLLILKHFAVSVTDAPYYKPTPIKEPKVKKKAKQEGPEFEASKFFESNVFKTILALIVLVLVALLIYKGVQMVKVAAFVNETNLTANQTLNITQNITQPTINQTTNQTANETGFEKLDLKPYLNYSYYAALSLAILFLLILVRIRMEQKPMKKRTKNKIKKVIENLKQMMTKYWGVVVLLVLVVVTACLGYYFRSALMPYLISLKDYALMYLLYVILGFVILVALLFVLSKIIK